MPKGFATDQRDVLVAMYGYFLTVEGGAYMHPRELQEKAKLRLSTSYISLLLEALRGEGWIEDNGYDDEPDVRFTMTRAGILEAEAEVVTRGFSLDEFEADFRRTSNTGMIVETDHPYLADADAALEELETHLREDNDIGNLTADDREVAKNEVAELRQAINKPKIRTHYLWSKAHDVLLWIMEKGAGSMISELAKRALKPIQDFINVFFN